MILFPGLLILLAQIAPGGPGQPVSQPPAECPVAIACTYGERNVPPDNYRFQELEVCGANCTTQYWVSRLDDGSQLLEIDPTRGGGVVALNNSTRQVRTVLPDYQPKDAACCPSQYADTTYDWDADSASLMAEPAVIIAAMDFPGWDGIRAGLQSDQFGVVF